MSQIGQTEKDTGKSMRWDNFAYLDKLNNALGNALISPPIKCSGNISPRWQKDLASGNFYDNRTWNDDHANVLEWKLQTTDLAFMCNAACNCRLDVCTVKKCDLPVKSRGSTVRKVSSRKSPQIPLYSTGPAPGQTSDTSLGPQKPSKQCGLHPIFCNQT